MYQISNITDPGQWEKIKTEWSGLLEESEYKDIFLTYEWLTTVWRFCGNGSLFIVVIRDGEKIACILPAYISRVGFVRILRFIGTGETDYGNFILHRDYHAQELLPILFDYLLEEDGWDVADLHQISDITAAFRYLSGDLLLRNKRKVSFIRFKEMVKCLYFPYAGEENAFKDNINKRMLRRIRSREKEIMAQENVTYHEMKEVSSEILQCFFDMHIKRWRALGQSSNLLIERYRNFYTELTKVFGQNGWLSMLALKFGEKYTAFEFTFRYNNKIYDYITTFDTAYEYYLPGHLLKRYMVLSNSNSSIREIDFLIGEEEYKYRWTKHFRTNYRFMLFRKNIRAVAAYILYNVKNKLGKTGLLSKITGIFKGRDSELPKEAEDDSN